MLVYPKATQDASTENLPAGTCLTSYDKSQSDRAAYAFMVGTENAVLTTCGRLVPDDSSSSGDGGNGSECRPLGVSAAGVACAGVQ